MPDLYNAKDKSKKSSKKTSSHKHHKKVRDAKEYSEVIRHEPESRNPLTAFSVRPKNIHLIVQESDEEILLLLRRHILTNVPWILTAILMLLGPFLLTVVPLVDALPFRFQLMTLVLWYLITTAFIIEKFLSWYFNVYLVTDERIIDIDFLNLLYRNISTAKIDQIQDITYEVTGGIRSILNFGTVSMQTAGERRELAFEDVPQPQKVVKLLNELILEEEQEKIDGRAR